MDIDQCVDVMRSLREAYQHFSQEKELPPNKVLELKHTVTELKLIMISIENSLKKMETRQKTS